jgi:nitrate reductase NapD
LTAHDHEDIVSISGIVVVVPPNRIDECASALRALPGVDMHHRDTRSGKLVVTLETDSVEAEVEGLKRIKTLPHVILAEMVYHYCGEDSRASAGSAEGETTRTGVPSALDH